MEGALTELLRPFWEEPERVWDLIGQGWLWAQSQRFFRQHSTPMSHYNGIIETNIENATSAQSRSLAVLKKERSNVGRRDW
jgi:hypothetical protein